MTTKMQLPFEEKDLKFIGHTTCSGGEGDKYTSFIVEDTTSILLLKAIFACMDGEYKILSYEDFRWEKVNSHKLDTIVYTNYPWKKYQELSFGAKDTE